MTTGESTSVEVTVQALLDAAKLTVSADEFQLFVNTYPQMRAGADGMYLTETRYEEPGLTFDARWAD
jgi:hypothetical protein